MTVKELKAVIEELPDDMNVFIEFYDGWESYISHIKEHKIDTEFGPDGYGLNRTCFYLEADKYN